MDSPEGETPRAKKTLTENTRTLEVEQNDAIQNDVI